MGRGVQSWSKGWGAVGWGERIGGREEKGIQQSLGADLRVDERLSTGCTMRKGPPSVLPSAVPSEILTTTAEVKASQKHSFIICAVSCP